jgi:hypothetical protein
MCNSYLKQISFFVNFQISDILNNSDIKKTADRLKRILNLRIVMRAAIWHYSSQLIVSFHPHLRHVPTAVSQAGMKATQTKLPSMLRKQTIQLCCLRVIKLRIRTLEMIRKPTRAVKEAPETTLRLWEEWAGISENWLFNWKCTNLNISYKRKIPNLLRLKI